MVYNQHQKNFPVGKERKFGMKEETRIQKELFNWLASIGIVIGFLKTILVAGYGVGAIILFAIMFGFAKALIAFGLTANVAVLMTPIAILIALVCIVRIGIWRVSLRPPHQYE